LWRYGNVDVEHIFDVAKMFNGLDSGLHKTEFDAVWLVENIQGPVSQMEVDWINSRSYY
jgi:hypothetical protein